jgi:polysaccharide biosynthesis/export protein
MASLAWSQAPDTGAAAPAPGVGQSLPGMPAGENGSQANGTAGVSSQTGVSDNTARTQGNNGQLNREQVLAVPQPPSEFQLMVQATTGRLLPVYGASLFRGVPSTFAPVTDVPVGPGYILGPGDTLRVQLTGQVNEELQLTVDRTGAVLLPGVGAVHVAGTAYSQLPALLNAALSKLYRNFSLNVNLASLRTIQVFVTGQALRPGSYSISSLSTLLNAIFASGGTLPQGSLRDIQVKRGGKTIVHFDLYDLLLKGDKTNDIPLETGDVIFIPVLGSQVAVLGSVNNPAIYELKSETTAAQALALAGGVTPAAAGTEVRLERVYEHAMRSVENVKLDGSDGTILQNGDVLSFGSVTERFSDAVTLRGNVANPGRYVWRPGMRISDLIPNRESLITRDYWRKRNLLGQPTPMYEPTPAEGALQVQGTGGVAQPAITNSTNPSSRTAQSPGGNAGGSSVGAALTSNTTAFAARNDVVLSAPDIDWSYAVIERQNTTNLTTSLISFNLGKLVLEGDSSQNFTLQPGDVITIFSTADVRVPSSQQTRFVRLEGEFVAAGVYSVLPGETLRALIQRAGGFTSDAYLYASEFTRESTRRVEEQRLREYADELEARISAMTSTNQARAASPADAQAAQASAADARAAVARLRNVQPIGRIVLEFQPNSAGLDSVPDLPLENGDRFIVPRVPSSVAVEGQVYNANAFLYRENQRALNYLQRAGGPDREADKKRMFVLRADGSVISQQYADVKKTGVYPGDTIVVPPILDKRSTMRQIVDIVQIIGNLGFTAATIAVLATN